jgi:hypothetical protein
MRAWVGPNIRYGAHAFGIAAAGRASAFDAFLGARERLQPWIEASSPAALLSADDGPFFLDYRGFSPTPCEPLDAYYTHSPGFGVGFQKLAEAAGVECRLRYAGAEDNRYPGWLPFLVAQLTGPVAFGSERPKSVAVVH